MRKTYLVLIIGLITYGCSKDEEGVPQNNTFTLPSITIEEITDITHNRALASGNVTNNGGVNITAKGICWSTTNKPTVNDNKTNNGTGIGIYSSELSGLIDDTTYYVRAYAINSEGVAYSNELSFTTMLNLPTVTISTITNITENSAMIGGNATSDGSAVVMSKGICWSTDPAPDLSDDITNEGLQNGSFVSQLNSLINNTTYYVRAYATNNNGTSYSEELSFKTVESTTGIFEGNVILFTQDEVNNFGMNNYTEITGDLLIAGSSSTSPNITDLTPLNGLTTIGNQLYINGNESLTNLDGLNNISSVANNLIINGNNALTGIMALGNLSTIGGGISISNNIMLTNLMGFDKLSLVPHYLTIEHNDKLTDISSLKNITEVGSSLYIKNNDLLINLNGLNNIIAVGSDLLIEQNHVLNDLNGLVSLQAVGRNFVIQQNNALTNLAGLNNLSSVAGKFSIIFNNTITSISDLSNLVSVGENMTIEEDALENLDGLNSLTSIGGKLSLFGNDLLINLNGLNNLSSVDGDLEIRFNGSLTDFCGLKTLLNGAGLNGGYAIDGNAFNPTLQNIMDNNCSQ